MLTTHQAEMYTRIVGALVDPTGRCYVAAEAVYHAIGGKASGWVPQVMRLPGGFALRDGSCVYAATHWYLRSADGLYVLDPTVHQFTEAPGYYGRGCGFLTKGPSRRARELLREAGLCSVR